ncbi:unnamed protein product [Coregonus sp. 'balchen']|nr:unnamed protein product [Coregonus sp. 'balchen']
MVLGCQQEFKTSETETDKALLTNSTKGHFNNLDLILDGSMTTYKGITSSHSLSTKSLQKLSSHAFQTKAEQGVSEVLSR